MDGQEDTAPEIVALPPISITNPAYTQEEPSKDTAGADTSKKLLYSSA